MLIEDISQKKSQLNKTEKEYSPTARRRRVPQSGRPGAGSRAMHLPALSVAGLAAGRLPPSPSPAPSATGWTAAR